MMNRLKLILYHNLVKTHHPNLNFLHNNHYCGLAQYNREHLYEHYYQIDIFHHNNNPNNYHACKETNAICQQNHCICYIIL